MSELFNTIVGARQRIRDNRDKFGNRKRISELERQERLEVEESKARYQELVQEAEVVEKLLGDPRHSTYRKYLKNTLEDIRISEKHLDPNNRGYSEKSYALRQLIIFVEALLAHPDRVVLQLQKYINK